MWDASKGDMNIKEYSCNAIIRTTIYIIDLNLHDTVPTCKQPFSMLASISGIHAVGMRVLMASVSK